MSLKVFTAEQLARAAEVRKELVDPLRQRRALGDLAFEFDDVMSEPVQGPAARAAQLRYAERNSAIAARIAALIGDLGSDAANLALACP